jgi:hypothetical protein
MEYKYNLRSRPFGIGTYPNIPSFIRFEEDGSRFGCVVYSEPLSIKMMDDFELVPITDILKYDGADMLWNDKYDAKISILKNDRGTNYVKIVITANGKEGKPMSESGVDFLKNIANGKYKFKEKIKYDWDFEFSGGVSKGKFLSELELNTIDVYADNIVSVEFTNDGSMIQLNLTQTVGLLSITDNEVKISVILDEKDVREAQKIKRRLQKLASDSSRLIANNPDKRDARLFPFIFISKKDAEKYELAPQFLEKLDTPKQASYKKLVEQLNKEKMPKFNLYDRISIADDNSIKGTVQSIEPNNEYLIKWDSQSEPELVPENELILAVEKEVKGDVYYTTATESYDGFGTRTLGMTDYLDTRNKPVRKIFIPEKAKEWQINRNASGNEGTFTEAEFEQYKNTTVFKKKEMTKETKTETKIVESIIQTEKNKAPLEEIQLQNAQVKDLSYIPASESCKSVDTVVPESMRYDMHKAIETVDRRVNGVDEYVAEKLGYIVGNCTMEQRKDGLKCLCDAFSSEQVDAIAVAIFNIEEKGQGCIIGDQTGIGKGRIAGGMVRYAINRGLKPIFLTEKPNLFSDLFRDIIAIGSDDDIPLDILVGTKEVEKKLVKKDAEDSDDDDEEDSDLEQTETVLIPVYKRNPDYPNSYTFVKTDENGNSTRVKRTRKKSMIPYIVNGSGSKTAIKDEEGHILYKGLPPNENKNIIESGKIPEGFDFVLSTYSQFRGATDSTKMQYLLKIAQGNIVIMDESHNASGQSNVGTFLGKVLEGTLGVTFLSATFSKRPDNMPIYAGKTAMSDANMTSDQLVSAITLGGVALQEIVSSNLVSEGQMIRRMRSFEGIEVNYEYLDVSQVERGYPNLDLEVSHRAIMDRATDIIRDIINFQRDYVDLVIEAFDKVAKAEYKQTEKRKGTKGAGVDNPPVFSGVFNIINQLLFSIKAIAVGDVAIQRLKEGKKPVIAFASTMESFLNTMTNDDGTPVEDGDIVNADFSKIFEKRLAGVLKYTEKDAEGNSTPMTLDVMAMDERFQAEYFRILNKIKGASIGISSSPIDTLIDRIQKAGYSCVEVTGRDRQLKILGNDKGQVKSRLKIGANDGFRQFNNNEIDCLLINQSGSTGASAHALPNAKIKADKVKQRVLIILQAELNISTEVQKRGRINRTGQIFKPIYDYVISSIPAEKRLMMMLQKKLKSLDANTSSSQKESEDLMDVKQVDFLNKYGDIIVFEYLKENPLVNLQLGDPLKIVDLKEGATVNIIDGAHKVSGRVAILSTKDQETFYKEIAQRYVADIEFRLQSDDYDLEVGNMNLEAETLSKEIVVVGKGGDSVFGRHSILEKCRVNNLKKPYSKAELDAIIKQSLGTYTEESLKTSIIDKYEKFVVTFLENEIKEQNEHSDNLIANIKKEKQALKTDDIQQYVKERTDVINEARDKSLEMLKISTRNKKDNISRIFNFFYVGKVIAYPSVTYSIDGAYYKGIFVGFVINDEVKNPYSPSALKLRFAIAGSQRYISVPASKFEILDSVRALTYENIYSDEQDDMLKNWDAIVKEKITDKSIRYIVTGNILQAYGKDELKGSLISYTTSTGGVKKGILLPEYFTTEARGEKKAMRITVPIVKALPIIKSMAIGRSIQTNDLFSLIRSNDFYKILVPLNKQKGSKFYLDATIIKLTREGTFNKSADQMIATIEERKITNLVNYLQDTFSCSVDLIEQEFDRIKGDLMAEEYADEEKKPEPDVFIEKLTEVNREGADAEKQKAFDEEQQAIADALEQAENDKKQGAEFEIEKRKLSAKKKLINLLRVFNNQELLMRRGGGVQTSNTVKTKDGVELEKRSNKHKGHIFYDEQGVGYECLGYFPKLDECVYMNLKTKKEVVGCMDGFFYNNPTLKKKNGGDINEYGRGGFMYEVQKVGGSTDMRDTLFTAKNVNELKKKIIEKHGSLQDISAKRRTPEGFFTSVKLETGGGIDEQGIDLFEDYENIPEKVQTILDKYAEKFGDDLSDMDYKDMADMHDEVYAVGYTFESGLDNQPYDLRPIGTKGKSEFDEYALGGGVGDYKLKDVVDFYYGRKGEEKVVSGTITDILNDGYTISTSFTQVKVMPSEIIGYTKQAEPKKKRFGIFKNGGEIGGFTKDSGGNYINSAGYELIDQFDGTYQVLDPNGNDIAGDYESLEQGMDTIAGAIDYEIQSVKNANKIYKHKYMDATAKIIEKTKKGYKVEFTDNSARKPKVKIMYFNDIDFDKDRGFFEKMI